MKPKMVVPQFEYGSYSERCQEFFPATHPFHDREATPNTNAEWATRAVTWARYPYRYRIEQSGSETRTAFQAKRIKHAMFEVSLLSALRTTDSRREYDRWYITGIDKQPEQIFFLSNLVEDPEVEKVSGEMSNAVDFTLANKLHIPNEEDLMRLDTILEQGKLDGFDPVHYQ